MKVDVSASILSCNFLHLDDELRKLEKKNINSFHLDIMDGNFVPNISFGPHISKCIADATSFPMETHLMVMNPLNFINNFLYSRTIFFHIESNDKCIEVINSIKKSKIRVGIAISPKTKYEILLPYINQIDDILVMTVEPGFGGQKFMYDQVEKIKLLNEVIQKNQINVKLSVDGGINSETSKICIAAGVKQLVAGSFLLSNDFDT